MVSDRDYWSAKSDELRRGGQLDTVQKSATAWAGLFSGILGVFGVVAFAGGLKQVDDLAPGWGLAVRGLTCLAALTLAVATYYAATAASTVSPELVGDTTWQNVRNRSVSAARKAFDRLQTAKRWGALTVGFVLGGTLLAIWAPSPSSSAPTVLVDTAGGVVCGRLARDAGGTLVVDEQPIESTASLTVVATCP